MTNSSTSRKSHPILTDCIIDRVDRRAKPASIKRGKAAWSRLEDVLAERRLEKELREIFEDDK